MNDSMIIKACGLTKSYQEVEEKLIILNQLDLTVHQGEMLAIVGSSGSGKSTLLHLLAGLDDADAGSVFIKDKDILRLSEKERCEFRRRHLGFIYQFHHLLPEFTALENVCMPLWINRVNKTTASHQAFELLERVGLLHRAKHRMAELSGGERQRVAIARALVTKPLCVLADELTGNLDHNTALSVMMLIKAMIKETQAAMVLVTHDAHLASLCDKQYTMLNGQLYLSS